MTDAIAGLDEPTVDGTANTLQTADAPVNRWMAPIVSVPDESTVDKTTKTANAPVNIWMDPYS